MKSKLFYKDDYCYLIDYRTNHSTGRIIVDKGYFDNNRKKFERKLKNVVIINELLLSWEEASKWER